MFIKHLFFNKISMDKRKYGVTFYYRIAVVSLTAGFAGGPFRLDNNNNVNLDTIEQFEENIATPLKAFQKRQKVKMENELIWGNHGGFGGAIVVGLEGSKQNLESALNDLFDSDDGAGIPYLIYRKNRIFSNNDTQAGIELAKSILESNSKVKKVKKAYLLFPSDFEYRIIVNNR